MAGQAQPDHAGLTPPRILILSASIGAGHDLPAEVMADELRALAPGAGVKILDTPPEAGPILEGLVDSGSLFHSRIGNLVFEAQHRALMQWSPGRRGAARVITRLARRPVLDIIERERPDVIVATWPGANEALGRMRLAGMIDVPVVSAITDLASLWYWAAPGIDLHLITHPESAAEVREIAGPNTRVEVVRGLNDPAWAVPIAEDDARRALGLPVEPKLVVVSGGGWGVGDMEGGINVALAREDTMVVALCGGNDELFAQLSADYAGNGRVQVWGFTDRMPTLFAAADALIHSTAGLTMLEAQMRGLPAISYGWGRGHIRLNNQAYARFGLAQVALNRSELAVELDHALARRPDPDLSFGELPTAASVVLGLHAERLLDGAGRA
jgi:UDP-N-acetylglucosamine:LPS N-acetylglucosamine transferase